MCPLLWLLVVNSVLAQVTIDNYFCGVDPVSKWTSYVMTAACDQAGVNICCYAHDQCYSGCSVPQSYCDAQFCQCLASLPADMYCRNVVIAGHCNLVQWLGHSYICSPMAQPLLG